MILGPRAGVTVLAEDFEHSEVISRELLVLLSVVGIIFRARMFTAQGYQVRLPDESAVELWLLVDIFENSNGVVMILGVG